MVLISQTAEMLISRVHKLQLNKISHTQNNISCKAITCSQLQFCIQILNMTLSTTHRSTVIFISLNIRKIHSRNTTSVYGHSFFWDVALCNSVYTRNWYLMHPDSIVVSSSNVKVHIQVFLDFWPLKMKPLHCLKTSGTMTWRHIKTSTT